MTHDNPIWYGAVTLAERVAGCPTVATAVSSQPSGRSEPHDDARLQSNDDARLQYCIDRWKSQRPFDCPEHFQQRLRLGNLTEDSLRQLITEPLGDLRDRLGADPVWMATTETALSTRPTSEFHDFLTERLKRNPTIGFLDVAAPFINLGLSQLETGAAALARGMAGCPFELGGVQGILFPDLARALLTVVSRTMVLELNVARLEGKLAGVTPEARFASFIAQLHDPIHLRRLFEEYPVLARLIAEHTSRWVAVSLELLERVSADFDAL